MNVTHQNTNALNAVLTVKVEQNDYLPKVEQSLKDYRKKAVIKGFRPGKAPATMINKMYRVPAIVEEVNKLISESISKYIFDNKLNILGEPLPSETQEKIDWETQKDFEFLFDMGLAPEFEINLSKRDKVPYYTIKIDKKIRQTYIDSICGRYGSFQESEKADNDSLLKANLTELNSDESPKENGITAADASISVMLVADEDEKKKMVGAKSGDVFTIDVNKAFPNETDRAALLKTTKENLVNLEPLFQATVSEVKQYVKAEVNQELFDKLYGEGTVNSEEEFHQRIDEDIKSNLKGDSERKFFMDTREKIIDKFSIELPREFLVRWLVAINEGKYSKEQIEKDYPEFEKDLKWQLVRDKIIVEQEFKVQEEELTAMAKGYILSQMMQYGMGQLPEEFIEKYANDLLTKKEEKKKIAERVLENKVFGWLKETIKLDEKEVDFEKFKSIMNA
jgi:trigger factor